jgi:hypothetical protein
MPVVDSFHGPADVFQGMTVEVSITSQQQTARRV